MNKQLETCNFCKRESIYLRSQSGERYCRRCYVKAVEKWVQRTISKYRLLKTNDRVAFALSGGKDSVALLHIMNKIEKRFPHSEIIAITIDEEIADYRSEAIKIAKENCNKLDMEHYVYSYKKLYGYTLDEIAKAARLIGKQFICSYCGILRRKALNIAARDLEASKLATAHNLDDEVQSMMMNVLRGDLAGISRISSNLKEDGLLIPRIKPLCEIPEKEVALYAFIKNIKFQSLRCNYLESSLRNDVRMFLNVLENKHSGMKYTIYRTFEKIRNSLNLPEERSLGLCKVCGEPTTREICMACQTLQILGLV